jgi:hypothetical protein
MPSAPNGYAQHMTEPDAELPVEAEPADVQEQQIVVEGDEESERPVTPSREPDAADAPEDA